MFQTFDDILLSQSKVVVVVSCWTTKLYSEYFTMFVKSPLGRTYYSDDLRTARDAIILVCQRENVPGGDWRVEQEGKPVRSLDSLLTNTAATLYVLPSNPLPGGKGGFGSLLRAIGAQIQKTTNHEAMRDLSGRRQRDVNNEQRMREYAAKRADREREELEKKEAKLQKLKRLAERENKHEFSDPQYDKARSETEEKVHDAVEAAMKVASDAKEAEKDLKRKAETEKKEEPPRKRGMWLGDDLEGLSDSELTDSEDENDVKTDKEAKTVAVL